MRTDDVLVLPVCLARISQRVVAARTLAAILILAVVLGSACATTGTGAPMIRDEMLARRFVLDYAHVPPPPTEIPSGVADAWTALRRGDARAADQALAALTSGDRLTAGAHTASGFLALGRGDAAESRTHFQQALAVVPEYSLALYGLGFLSEAVGNRAAGLDWYSRAVQAAPGLSEAAVRLQVLELEQAQAFMVDGELAEGAGDSGAAGVAYEAALELGPDVLRPYLRIAEIRRLDGDLDAAVRVLRSARDRIGELRLILEPLAGALLASGAYAEAYDAYQALEEVVPDDPEVWEMVAAARELYFATSLPEEYRRLEDKPQIVREDMAALIAIRLPNLGERVVEARTGVIITDIDDSWAEVYIRELVEWGVMQVFQNHGFSPGLVVKRQMFAEIAYRVLELLDAVEGTPHARLGDVASEHYLYDEIGVVVGHGILELGPRNRFGILDPLSGAEAVAAIQKLVRIARGSGD